MCHRETNQVWIGKRLGVNFDADGQEQVGRQVFLYSVWCGQWSVVSGHWHQAGRQAGKQVTSRLVRGDDTGTRAVHTIPRKATSYMA